MQYVQEVEPALDLFRDQQLAEFRRTLDSEMKHLRLEGLGTMVKQAERTTNEEEECLWEKRMLGLETPLALLDTMVYMCGLYFALRSTEVFLSTS